MPVGPCDLVILVHLVRWEQEQEKSVHIFSNWGDAHFANETSETKKVLARAHSMDQSINHTETRQEQETKPPRIDPQALEEIA